MGHEGTDLFALDKVVRAHDEHLRARARLLRTSVAPATAQLDWSREVSSRATFDDLGERTDDPLSAALRVWVAHLTIERVTEVDVVRIAERETEKSILVHGSIVPTSHRELAAVVARGGADAPASLDALTGASGPVQDALFAWADRRTEALARLGLKGASAIEHPGIDRTEIVALAHGLLDATDDLGGDGSVLELARRGLAADSAQGWPTHLTSKWLGDLFSSGPLLAGLRPDVGDLPRPAGAASFARALHALGLGIASADLPRGIPFALARAPTDPLGSRRAALLASIVTEPAFHRKKLGLGRAAAASQARAVGRSATLWVRIAAYRSIAWDAIVQAGELSQRRSRIRDAGARAFGVPPMAALAGVFPRARSTSHGELHGIALACADRFALRDRFDEDWFDNPRAHEALRHEHQASCLARGPATREPAVLLAGARRWLEEAV